MPLIGMPHTISHPWRGLNLGSPLAQKGRACLASRGMVDYSKFSKIEDSDEEPHTEALSRGAEVAFPIGL